MAREFPDWIDPWKAAEGQRIFSGVLPLSRLGRLSSLLASTEGEVAFKTRFHLDAQRRALVDIEVAGELPLICQVSLETFLHRVERNSRLTIIENELDQLELPEEHEATCVEDGRLSLASLVEDECILALPQVPRRPGLEFEPDTDRAGASSGEDTYKPFARLGELLGPTGTEPESENS